MTYPLTRAGKGSPLTQADHDRNLPWPTVGALLSDKATSFPTSSRFWTIEEGFRYRVADPSARDHHLTTAGGVKLYVLPADLGMYNVQAFGAVPDGKTDCYLAFRKACDIEVAQSGSGNRVRKGAHIYVPPGEYYLSKTLNVSRNVSIISHTCPLGHGAPASPTLKWAPNTGGFIFHRDDTWQDTVVYEFASVAAISAENLPYLVAHSSSRREAGAYYYANAEARAYRILPEDAKTWDLQTAGGLKLELVTDADAIPPRTHCRGSVIDGLVLEGGGGTNRHAHGVWMRTAISLRNCIIRGFPGHGVAILAATSTSNPYWLRGNANRWHIDTVRCAGNGMSGIYLQGADANAGAAFYADGSNNRQWGIWDNSGIGNSFFGCHTNGNGSNGAVVHYQGSDGVVRRYDANPFASEAELATYSPESGYTVGGLPIWVSRNQTGTHNYTVEWRPGQPVGTYFSGGSYRASGASNRCLFLGTYAEGNQCGTVMEGSAINMGGHSAFSLVGGDIQGRSGGVLRAVRFEADNGPSFGGEDGVTMLSGLGMRLRAFEADIDCRIDSNTNVSAAWGMTRDATTKHFGRGAGNTIPKLFYAPAVALGASTSSDSQGRRITVGTAPPSSGQHARGEIVFNQNPSPSGYVGWVCTATGNPGTWKGFGAIEG